ncbi:MAG: undecaprenyl-diphosphate phosphatase [Clostridia bacterium]|nr:undecaprenyl-diphosphate phosphatase [Clostridia bacterium]
MQNFLALFFLGVLQGLTEFLPVSSSGHLVLFSKIFGIEESLFLSIFLHVATLLSIVVVFHKDVWQMLRHPFSKQTMNLVAATIPTCLIVLVIMPLVKQSFAGGLLPVCFAISASLLLLAEGLSKSKKLGELDTKTAVFMGIAQGFAVFPGISRSGTTISAGLIAGKNKEEVAKFSFLMSIPIVFLSLVMEIYEITVEGMEVNLPVGSTIFSFVAAFLVGIFAIKVMMRLTSKSNLKWFSFYLVIISLVSLFFV